MNLNRVYHNIKLYRNQGICYMNFLSFIYRPKMRESTLKGKKLDISIGHKNYTLDSQYLENYSRNTKS